MTQTADIPLLNLMPKLRRRARRLCRSPEEAEDMVQEAALRLWQARDENRQIDAPERYAMVMLHNLARQRWRQRRPTDALTDEAAQEVPLAPARLACAELSAAIGRLPPDQAALMQLVIAGETSPKQMSVQLDIPKGTVMSRLARARARLRREMGLGRRGSIMELM